jgi:hypothetical protein
LDSKPRPSLIAGDHITAENFFKRYVIDSAVGVGLDFSFFSFPGFQVFRFLRPPTRIRKPAPAEILKP